MISLIIILLIDTSIVKVYDLIDKDFISERDKILLFSINAGLCILLEFIIIKYLQNSFKRHQLKKAINVNLFYRISLISLLVITTLMGLLILQQFYNNYYKTLIPIFIIILSYGTAVFFIIVLSMLFFTWYKSNHNWIVFLYFISMIFIAFNLSMTAIITVVKLMDRPDEIREFVGGTVDISVGKYVFLDDIYKVSSIMSFSSLWITTALLMNYYREKLINVIVYWILLSIPLLYFVVNYIYQFIFANILIPYLTIDPITVSIILTAFLSLSKPIGGLTFAVAFWNISKNVSYEKNIKAYMIISGWGLFLIFGANQALVQTLAPYPPFGLVTTSVLIIAALLMLLGIYNSAALVSANEILRKSIYTHAFESRLLGLIGKAEMENEIEKIVNRLTQHRNGMKEKDNIPIELDEKELKKYIDFVIREIKTEDKNKK